MRKEYNSPEVVVYGRIDQVTLGEGEGGLDDWVSATSANQATSVAASRWIPEPRFISIARRSMVRDGSASVLSLWRLAGGAVLGIVPASPRDSEWW
ncbi:MAG: hypothetical protein M3Q29_07115 [Chloroflexota bacterium]|nr:hypothetical protein [Chloroflexota bacterium]